MAGYNLRYIRLLIRTARGSVNQPDANDLLAIAWLQNLATAATQKVISGASDLISSSINGKSITLQIPPGMSRADAAMALESAIEWLEAGLFPTSEVHGSFGCNPGCLPFIACAPAVTTS